MTTIIIPEIRHIRRIRKPLAPPDTKTLAYAYALAAVDLIDENLTGRKRHYRTKAGLLLTTLDEVTRAILDGSLLEPAEVLR